MKKLIAISAILLVLLVSVYFIFNSETAKADPRGNAYAGSAACVKCHSNLYSSYLHTAHYIAAVPASAKTIHGSFVGPDNVVNIGPTKNITMEKLDSGLFQTYYLNGKFQERHRFDIVLGGVKGESYLFWNGDGLNQLPISYYSKPDKWMMSPRYDPNAADFSRIITSRCLQCHASFIADQPATAQRLRSAEQFDKSSLVYSVDCERCHGPAAQHVEFQTNNPDVKTAKYITSFSSLPRARRMDMCAVCHSGNKSQMIRSTFFFKPGDTLANFKLADFYTPVADTAHLDVHGNQVQLLESSKCFINSQMDCATCHDTHQYQRGNIALFTQKCLRCHSITNHNYCKMGTTTNAQLIKTNCVQCHMPTFTTNVIVSANADKTVNTDIFVRSHHIAIYPGEAKKILSMLSRD